MTVKHGQPKLKNNVNVKIIISNI